MLTTGVVIETGPRLAFQSAWWDYTHIHHIVHQCSPRHPPHVYCFTTGTLIQYELTVWERGAPQYQHLGTTSGPYVLRVHWYSMS